MIEALGGSSYLRGWFPTVVDLRTQYPPSIPDPYEREGWFATVGTSTTPGAVPEFWVWVPSINDWHHVACGDLVDPMSAAGDMIYNDSEGVPAALPISEIDYQVLTAVNKKPTWDYVKLVDGGELQ